LLSDCLKTLEEIAWKERSTFGRSGVGEHYTTIIPLFKDDNDAWVVSMGQWD